MRKRNGIPKVQICVRLDKDIHQWSKDSSTNLNELTNILLRQQMENWKKSN